MKTRKNPKFTVVGAGLSGALMAGYLAKAGYTVRMFEKLPDPRRGDAPAGRSINLAISTRGIHALEELGIADEVLASAVPMRGRMMHAESGDLTFQPYGTEERHVINSVSRAGLNIALLNVASKYSHAELRFNQRCTGADLDAASVEITNGTSGERHMVPGDIVIGSDGAFSVVRGQMVHLDRFDFRRDYLTHGYKELIIPPAPGGGFRLEKNALHIWPRGGFMMIALPNFDGSYTCTLFWPFEGEVSFGTVKTEDDIRRVFERHFPDAVGHMPTLLEDFQNNPTSSLATVRCSPWYYKDKVVLLGDAAHAVVPFYGQGMNASFEDCTVLNECIREHAPDWERTFAAYHRLRKENVDALADLAISNFVEMRDQVGSARFLWKKRSERILARLFPTWFVPLYTMVSFSRIPYAEAVRRAKKQDRVVGFILGLLLVMIVIAVAWLLT
ncbi:MAG: FAD-dependent monooxygenase [Planctomycetes bacterium]|nr:FAD-dependent monooxygenase [Planctomycetota bacterium]